MQLQVWGQAASAYALSTRVTFVGAPITSDVFCLCLTSLMPFQKLYPRMEELQ